ncbi:MAG: PAS domain S-box protein [Syntrophaceae bacterium]|nr:PAS domain S-box protein [Syntrophaceae bacterium]
MRTKSEKTVKNKTRPESSPTLRKPTTKPSNYRNEDRYQNFLENINDGCFEVDLAGNFIFFNDSICRILGYSSKELMGMNYRRYTDEKNAKKVFETYNKVYKTGKPFEEFNWEVTRKDGSKKYVEGSISLLKDSSGKSTGFLGVVNDITERKRSEEFLKQSEEQYRLLADHVKDQVWLMDMKFNLTYTSPSVEKLLGYTAGELKQITTDKLITPTSLQKATNTLSEAMAAPRDDSAKRTLELEFICKNGRTLWAECTFSFIKNEKGKPISILGEGRDITERKKAEDLLKESEAKYRLLAEHTKDAVWITDLDLNVTYISPSAVKLLGWTMEETKQLPLERRLTPESFKKAIDFYSTEMPKVLAAPTDYILNRSLELEFTCKDGRTLWAECIFSLIRDDNGNPISILGESRDITERKKIEEELRASESNFRHSFDDSPLGVRISTVEGETIYANRAILDIYGYNSIEELKNTSLKERYTPESYAEWQVRKAKRLQGGVGPSEYEISIVRKTGEIRHLYVLRKEIFWNGKKQHQVIYQDITLHRQAEEKLKLTMENLRKSIKATIQVLGMASEARDPYTAGHHKRVSDLARAIATEMGLPQDNIEGIRVAGSIHDIGKLSIPAEILSKPTKLTDLEFSMVKLHSQSGYEMLRYVESPWPLAEIVLQHHERINGLGYPKNLEGADILLEARIMAVADVVEAMSSHRPYRPALGIEAALREIEENKGILYDKAVVDACLRLFREKGYQLG